MARARARARVMPVRGLIGNPAFRRQKQNGIYTPIKSRLTPVAGWGFNGHANPASNNPQVPYTPTTLDAMSRAGLTQCYDRIEMFALGTWTGAGRPAVFDGTIGTKWDGANGIKNQLAANKSAGITSIVLNSSPGIGGNPGTQNVADTQGFFQAVAANVAPYTNYIEMSNESVNANSAYPAAWITLFSQVSALIKAVNPNAVLLGPTGTWGFANNAQQTAFWADNRATGLMDGFASHIYDFNRNTEQICVTAGIYPSVGSNQPTSKPRWMTEFGWAANSAGIAGQVANNFGRYLFALVPNNSHDYYIWYQLQQISGANDFGLYDATPTILAQGVQYLNSLKHCAQAQTYRLYRPGSGTWYMTKMDCLTGQIGTSERLAAWDTAGSTKTFMVYSHGVGTLNIDAMDGTSSTQALQAGYNSVSVTLGNTAKVLWSPDCVVEFPEFLDS